MPNYSGVWSLPTQMQAIADQNWPMGPGAPTAVSASAGEAEATITFTAPSFTGVPPGITGYLATSIPGGITTTGAASPLTVTGLTNGTAYSFNVQATNSVQYGPAGTSGSVTPAAAIAIFSSLDPAANGTYPQIESVNIATTGNSTYWGDLTQGRNGAGSCSSSTRGVVIGGNTSPNNTMDYITFSSSGNAVDFGDLSNGANGISAAGNSTRGIITRIDDVFYITIASTGNSTNFGNWSAGRTTAGMTASSTRAVVAGGDSGGNGTMQYVTIATTGSVATFGNISGMQRQPGNGNVSNGVRGAWMGFYGYNGIPASNNVIYYITIASTGNAVDFGDLTTNSYGGAQSSSMTRAVLGGGASSTGATNIIQYITLATTGNATDFGDLSTSESNSTTGMSNAHGGLS